VSCAVVALSETVPDRASGSGGVGNAVSILVLIFEQIEALLTTKYLHVDTRKICSSIGHVCFTSALRLTKAVSAFAVTTT
jgi:hypothetical protein